MARHGENIRKRQDGRWEGRYAVYSEEKGRKVYRSVYGRTYEIAREKLTIQKNLLREASEPGDARDLPQRDIRFAPDSPDKPEGEAYSSGEKSFGLIAGEWLCEVQGARKRSTYIKYSYIYHTHLEKPFADVSLSLITDRNVRKRISVSLSDSIRKSVCCVLNQILKFASRRYFITLPGIRIPAGAARIRPIEVLNRKEQKKLISALNSETTGEEKGDPYKKQALLCLYTGLRLGELCALKWDDIDFDNEMIIVGRTIQRLPVEGQAAKTALVETEPKSGCSRREIPLSSPASALLLGIKKRGEYVFGGKKPTEPRTLQYHFKKFLREASLPDKNFHILRHTFATNCAEGGADAKSLSEILGHSDVQLTLNRYVHPTLDTKRRHLDSLSLFYGQIYGQNEKNSVDLARL